MERKRYRSVFASLVVLLATFLAALPGLAQESPYLYGIHDHEPNPQEYLNRIANQGATGWVTATFAIGADPNNNSSADLSWIANQGHTVIGRLNYGYFPNGTIPPSAQYANFAQRCAKFAQNSSGIHIWVIGNETNLAAEWPAVNGHLSYVSPQNYANCFRQVYNAIKAVRPNDKVIPQALAPWAGPYPAGNIGGYTHDSVPLNWVQYLNQMLTAIKNSGPLDGIALHINSRGYTYSDIHSTQKVNAGGQNLYFSFYVYKDWIDLGIPSDLYHLPLYATECNGNYYWSGGHPENPSATYVAGWMQEVYAEINRYNQAAISTGKPKFRAVNMYRWCNGCDGWNIDGSPFKGQILADLDQAVAAKYTWPGSGGGNSGNMIDATPTGVNIALTATQFATDSNYSSAFAGDKAKDGVISAASKWTSTGSSSTHWIKYDLGSNRTVTGFIVRHAGAGGEPSYYNTRNFRLQTSTSYNGPWVDESVVDNSSQANVTQRAFTTPKTLRYVRLYITNPGIDNYARIPEFEVWGPASTGMVDAAPSGVNLALAATQFATDSNYSSSFAGDKAKDGIISAGSKWTSTGSTSTHWLKYDLGNEKTVTGFIVRHAGAGGEPSYYNTKQFQIQSSTSYNGPWTDEVVVNNSSQANVTQRAYISPKTLRYVRLYITDPGIDYYARIPEFEVWGPGSGGGAPLTVAEDFEVMPSWSSSYDASWGGAATWDLHSGGQSGNALRISRTTTGSSAKAMVYNITPYTNYTISVYARCPSTATGNYWAECAFKFGSNTAQDFDSNGGTWSMIKKFDSGSNGNNATWTQYSTTFYSGAYNQVTIGFKLGVSSGDAPTIRWDTLRIQ